MVGGCLAGSPPAGGGPSMTIQGVWTAAQDHRGHAEAGWLPVRRRRRRRRACALAGLRPLLKQELCLEKLAPAAQWVFLFHPYFSAAPRANDAGRRVARSTVAVISINNYRNLCLLISD